MSYNYLESGIEETTIPSSEHGRKKDNFLHLPMMNLRILMESRHG
ncbi:hypothetical protein [Streptococcus dysgalactiae]|nr:hypothetical protein [Streptococcus dysgalactiae]